MTVASAHVGLRSIRWYHTLVNTPFNALVTVMLVGLLAAILPAALEWLLLSARFGGDSPQDCAQITGACWAFIAQKHRVILFGLYPYAQQWRPLLVCVVLIGIVVLSCRRRFWRPALAIYWLGALALVGGLMWGGVLGLSFVETRLWGGLPLTLILATVGVGLAFPLGVLLALGRRSDLPAVRSICVIYIELIRGVPLISLLFMASVMLPLFLPEGLNINKLLRAQIAIVLFVAAYIAETVRGGLQAIPKGQHEGADSLGLGYWQKTLFIVLPQALRAIAGPLVGIFISVLKDTSLVVVIGVFDLMQATKAALADAQWQGFSTEAYLFIGAIYFVLCFSISRYSQSLERQWHQG
jgi:general L-amino acid transport system permease protein